MRIWRAAVAVLLAASLTGAAGALCRAQPPKPMPCCASERHEGRRKTPPATCADRCASPQIATPGAAAPLRADRFIAILPSGAALPVVAARRRPLSAEGSATYESPPPVRLSDRAPPAR